MPCVYISVVSNDMTAFVITISDSCERKLKMLCRMDQDSDVRWVLKRLKSPATRQFVPQFALVYIKEFITVLHGPFVSGNHPAQWMDQ